MARNAINRDDHVEDVLSSIMALLLSMSISMVVFALGAAIAYGPHVPFRTGVVLLCLLLGIPLLTSLATYVALRRRR